MADIDSIIAGVGGGTRADFTKLPGILDSYYKGQDQAYQQEGRDLFKGGVPTTADGQPDFAAMGKALFQHGDFGSGTAAANLDLARQGLQQNREAGSFIATGQPGGGSSAPVQPIVGPSTSRNSVTIDPSKRADNNAPQAAPQSGQPSQPRSGQPATIMTILDAQGIPNDQLGAASASIARQLGVNPTDPLDINNPQVRNVLAPAVAQLKRMGIGQVVPQGQPTPPPQEINPQQPPQAPQAQQPATNPFANAQASGLIPAGVDPQRYFAGLKYRAAALPAGPAQKAAQSQVDAITKATELTSTQRDYNASQANPKIDDYVAGQEGAKVNATEDAKQYSAKYHTLVDAGTKAQQEVPQLELLQEQMNDPNFFSGAGEKYNLAYKRLKSAFGIDPDAAVPQEFLRKATAASVLGSFGALKGLGPIRVAEMNLAKEAAAAPTNSIPANKLLVEIQKRTYQRQGDLAEMAQNYKEKNGSLDAGFDKQTTAYFKAHPIFSDTEIKDFHKAIGEAPRGAVPSTSQSFAGKKFDSPVAARAAGAKSGDIVTDASGKQWKLR